VRVKRTAPTQNRRDDGYAIALTVGDDGLEQPRQRLIQPCSENRRRNDQRATPSSGSAAPTACCRQSPTNREPAVPELSSYPAHRIGPSETRPIRTRKPSTPPGPLSCYPESAPRCLPRPQSTAITSPRADPAVNGLDAATDCRLRFPSARGRKPISSLACDPSRIARIQDTHMGLISVHHYRTRSRPRAGTTNSIGGTLLNMSAMVNGQWPQVTDHATAVFRFVRIRNHGLSSV